LFEEFQNNSETLGFDLNYVRGKIYDNKSNLRRKQNTKLYQKINSINPRDIHAAVTTLDTKILVLTLCWSKKDF